MNICNACSSLSSSTSPSDGNCPPSSSLRVESDIEKWVVEGGREVKLGLELGQNRSILPPEEAGILRGLEANGQWPLWCHIGGTGGHPWRQLRNRRHFPRKGPFYSSPHGWTFPRNLKIVYQQEREGEEKGGKGNRHSTGVLTLRALFSLSPCLLTGFFPPHNFRTLKNDENDRMLEISGLWEAERTSPLSNSSSRPCPTAIRQQLPSSFGLSSKLRIWTPAWCCRWCCGMLPPHTTSHLCCSPWTSAT